MGIWFVYSFFLYVHHLNLHVCPSVPAILFGYTYQIVVVAVMTVTMPFCHHLTTTCSVYMNEAKEWFALLFTFRVWCNLFCRFSTPVQSSLRCVAQCNKLDSIHHGWRTLPKAKWVYIHNEQVIPRLCCQLVWYTGFYRVDCVIFSQDNSLIFTFFQRLLCN